MESLSILLVICAVFGLLGAVLAEHRGLNRVSGFVAGALLGILGLIILVLVPRGDKKEAEPVSQPAVPSD